MSLARDFLEEYTLADEYQFFERDGEQVDRLIYCQLASSDGDELRLDFEVESQDEPVDAKDPVIVGLVEKAIAALRSRHPEFQRVKITYEIGA